MAMCMTQIHAQAEIVIARPINVVRTQFMDLAHHVDTRVHPTIEVSDIHTIDRGYRYTMCRRVLGMVHRDEAEQVGHDDGHITFRVIAGTNEGLVLTHRFEEVEGKGTRVTATIDAPVQGLFRILSPFVRMGMQRDLRVLLEQDRTDLEERGYSAA